MNSMLMRLLARAVYMNEAAADGGDVGSAAPAAVESAPPAAAPAAAESTLMGAEPAKLDAEGNPVVDPAAAKTEDKPVGAPEKYEDFTIPEGMAVDPEVMGAFQGWAKSNNISQKAAQELVDLQTKMSQGGEEARREQLGKALEAQSTAWANEIKNDPDLGGDKFPATMAIAVKAMQFAPPELRELLNESGIGNHPALIKWCHNLGSAISEDKMVMPGNQTSGGKLSAAEIMYGKGN